MKEVKVVCWNIAGGYLINTNKQFDYSKQEIEYFVENIKSFSPNIVFLQETHTLKGRGDSLADMISRQLGLPNVFNSPASASHIDSRYRLGNAVLSDKPLIECRNLKYPQVPFELYFKNGKRAVKHRKLLQLCSYNGEFLIGNTHFLPLMSFGYAYDKGDGKRWLQEIDKIYRQNVKTPLIFGGDFYFEAENNVLKTLAKLNMKDSLPKKRTCVTHSKMNHPDHILYSPEFSVVESEIVETLKADHFLCYSRFRY